MLLIRITICIREVNKPDISQIGAAGNGYYTTVTKECSFGVSERKHSQMAVCFFLLLLGRLSLSKRTSLKHISDRFPEESALTMAASFPSECSLGTSIEYVWAWGGKGAGAAGGPLRHRYRNDVVSCYCIIGDKGPEKSRYEIPDKKGPYQHK